jgi:ankyrin repeat protein
MQLGALFVSLALWVTPALARTSRDAPVPSHGKMGPDLFLAINSGNLAGVKSLLSRGADPNARNGLEMTPLMLAAASNQTEVMEALLGAGAKMEGSCIFGTALTFAVMTGATPAAKLLLAKGASPNPSRPDGITVLMLAARDGNVEVLRELLGRKPDVNAKDGDGSTALTYAARDGHEEAGRLLLESGAAVDAADSHKWTPLMYAAVNGHPEFVQLLLDKGANVNAKDARKRTPLVLAATYGDHPAVIRALLAGGAELSATDDKNRSAATLASTRGYDESAAVLRERGVTPAMATGMTQRTPQAAVQASLTTLQGSMRVFTSLTGCISCHQEGLGRVVTGAAKQRGLATDAAVAKAQLDRISGALTALLPLHQKALQDPAAMKNVPLIEIGEVPPAYTFMLAGLVAHRQPATPAISAATQVLARQQMEDGHWQFSLHRIPMQSSYFTMTALSVQVMNAYMPKSRASEVADRLRRARSWLLATPVKNSDDRAYRLLGLKWAGASSEDRQKSIEELRAAQHPDGGWSQEPTMQSDAYATGQALYALHVGGGVPVTDPIYQRGAQFLLRTQEEDGSWYVAKRAIPANNYFDSHFPHGQSQYASFNATCWATLALMQQIEPRRPGAQQAAR